ncbi:hypothetical protein D3C85_805230 [compost metagenome]
MVHNPYFTIVIAFLGSHIIFNKHNLCTNFKLQAFIIRISMFIKLTANLRIKEV